ncbi:hypothetical protein T261_1127 [Streptomyces lydicus]|nr:hypothetical protein T261_1127 [Streptomyces lydicus]
MRGGPIRVGPGRAAEAIRFLVLRMLGFSVLSIFQVITTVLRIPKAIEVSPYAATPDRPAVPAAGAPPDPTR